MEKKIKYNSIWKAALHFICKKTTPTQTKLFLFLFFVFNCHTFFDICDVCSIRIDCLPFVVTASPAIMQIELVLVHFPPAAKSTTTNISISCFVFPTDSRMTASRFEVKAHHYRITNFHETLGSSEFNPIPSVSSNNVTSFFTRLNEVTKCYCPGLLASFEPGLDSMMPFIPICAFTVPADSSKRRSNIPSTKRLTL